jgi:hypothetical protein
MRGMASPYATKPAATPRAPPPAASHGGFAIGLPIVAALAVGALVVVFLVLPIVIRSRCIAMAAEHGVSLTMDHVNIGLGEVRLVDVGFTLDGVSQIAAKAADAQVSLNGLTPTNATVHSLAVTIDGPADAVQAALDDWRANRARDVRAAREQKIEFGQATFTWTKAFGQTAKLSAPDLTGELDATNGTMHLTAEHLSLTAGDATFGPWRASIERDAEGTRTNVELDPVVHGGPSVLYVRTASGAVSIKANVARSPLSRLGLPPKALKLGSDPAVEAQISFDETLANTAMLDASVTLSGARFSGIPTDAALRLRASGDPRTGLDVKDGTLKAGPLTATVTGTVKLFPDGVRLALAWTGRPVPCAEVGKSLAGQALGDLGAQVGAMAEQLGGLVGLRVNGDAAASGLITLDSRDVSATSFTMTSNETCGLALF